jgi:hypothetical protein
MGEKRSLEAPARQVEASERMEILAGNWPIYKTAIEKLRDENKQNEGPPGPFFMSGCRKFT